MIVCHVCKTECDEECDLCPVCGAQLRREEEVSEPEEQEEEVVILKNPTLLAAMEDVVSAEIFRDILRDNNIPFTCDAADDSLVMNVSFGGGFVSEDIYVDESDFDEAQRLYEEFLKSEAENEALLFEEDGWESEDA